MAEEKSLVELILECEHHEYISQQITKNIFLHTLIED